jgi:hypothetical protein
MRHVIVKIETVIEDGKPIAKKSVAREIKDKPYSDVRAALVKLEKEHEGQKVSFSIHSLGNEKDLRAFKAKLNA